MAIAINLANLCYPDAEIRAQIIRGDWLDIEAHQWAILVGSPYFFAPVWDALIIDKKSTITAREVLKKLQLAK